MASASANTHQHLQLPGLPVAAFEVGAPAFQQQQKQQQQQQQQQAGLAAVTTSHAYTRPVFVIFLLLNIGVYVFLTDGNGDVKDVRTGG